MSLSSQVRSPSTRIVPSRSSLKTELIKGCWHPEGFPAPQHRQGYDHELGSRNRPVKMADQRQRHRGRGQMCIAAPPLPLGIASRADLSGPWPRAGACPTPTAARRRSRTRPPEPPRSGEKSHADVLYPFEAMKQPGATVTRPLVVFRRCRPRQADQMVQ